MTTDLCTTASIRSALGVSEREIRDDVLLDPIYSIRLSEALRLFSADLVNDYTTTAALGTKTTSQQRFVDVVQAYSAYFVALQCVGAAPMFAPKQITDGKTQVVRVDDPYKNLRGDLAGALAFFKTSLISAYSALYPGMTVLPTTARVNVVISPLGTNPVTG